MLIYQKIFRSHCFNNNDFFLVILYQLNTNFNELIVLMSLIAIAAYKILPALHTILFNLSAFNGNIESYYQIKNQIDIVLDKNYKKCNQVDNSNIEFKDSFNKLAFQKFVINFQEVKIIF